MDSMVLYLYICILYCCFHCSTEHSAPLFHSIIPNFRNLSVRHLGNIIICPNINVVFHLLAALSYHTTYYVVFVVTQSKVQPTRMLQWRMGVTKPGEGLCFGLLYSHEGWPQNDQREVRKLIQSSSSEHMCIKLKRSRCESARSVVGTTAFSLNLSTSGKTGPNIHVDLLWHTKHNQIQTK